MARVRPDPGVLGAGVTHGGDELRVSDLISGVTKRVALRAGTPARTDCRFCATRRCRWLWPAGCHASTSGHRLGYREPVGRLPERQPAGQPVDAGDARAVTVRSGRVVWQDSAAIRRGARENVQPTTKAGSTLMRAKINMEALTVLQPGQMLNDNICIGFSARRQTSSAVSFALRYKARTGKPKSVTIGRWQSPWSPEEARQEATHLLREAAHGRDPAEAKAAAHIATMTVSALVAEYRDAMTSGRLLTKSGKPKAQSTQSCDETRLRLHILPVLGKTILGDLTKRDCERLMHDIADGTTTKRQADRMLANSARGGKAAASRTITLLCAMLNFAIDRGHATINPAKGIRRFAETRRDRHLSDQEYSAFGQALRSPPAGIPPAMLAAIQFTALSGWRCGEVATLRWDAVDLTRRVAVLADTKTGSSTRPLSQAAIAVLGAQEQLPGQVLVFAPSRRQRPGYAYRAAFGRLVRAACLSNVTPHVLRHSFVSTAGDLELSEFEHRGLHRTRDTEHDRQIHAPRLGAAFGSG